ncbi:FAD/NAD(P)-binding domain-containing protein [Pterulicium gracile]|uniref:FAD/NAD(P)-binding domain-containing protein n=1 Tax=Pterulicium gracile TaxID=1884261 RepID=A0A5C3QX25_9AGAR|nr:FAD/NAD(P)-binding domain-containing protein [Pterula gracilis]
MYPSQGIDARPLHVAICGAGISGFAAAIALRNQGHIVELYEKASFSKEFGAAIGVPPNGTRVLNHLGYNRHRARAVDYYGVTIFRFHSCARHQEWTTVHRVDMHNELRYLAMKPDGKGTPAKLFLSSAVESCDAKNGVLRLASGKTRQFDLIIGADGIDSKIRSSVVGKVVDAPIAPKPAAIFRWCMPVEVLEGRPDLDWIMTEGIQGSRVTSSAEGHFLVSYLCRDKKVINSLAFHIDKRDQTKFPKNVASSKEEMLEEFKQYAPKYIKWIQLAEGVRHWQMRTLPVLDTWVNGHTCLIGDAAHAMFPTLGHGAAMGLEDACVLAGLLPAGTAPSQVNERLRAFEHLRKDRDEWIAHQSEIQALDPEHWGIFERSHEQQDKMMLYDAPKVAADYYNKHFAHKQAPAFLESAHL